MNFQVQVETTPIHMNADGVALIGNTRVTLETVVTVFNRGATPEAIVIQYPALTLSEIYLVIGYYLTHQDEIDNYIAKQQELSDQVRQEIEARTDLASIRERMLARRSELNRKAE